MRPVDIYVDRFYTMKRNVRSLTIRNQTFWKGGAMTQKYDRSESWEKEHGGAPVKCILDVSKNIRYFFDLAMSANGLTSIQSRILGHLRHAQEQDRCVFQREIEEVFRIKRSSVTSVLQTLEKKGLIIRESISEDARLKKLVLTEEAKKMQVDTYQALGDMEKLMRSLFTEEEFKQFLDYMNRIDKKAIELYYAKETE